MECAILHRVRVDSGYCQWRLYMNDIVAYARAETPHWQGTSHRLPRDAVDAPI